MLIIARTAKPSELADSNLKFWSDDDFTIGWKGHLFWPDEAAGEPSVVRLAGELGRVGLAQAMAPLGGVFGLLVFVHATGEWWIAGDNAGLYKIYHDGERVSTSFLALARRRPVSPEAAVEMVTLGAVHGPATLAQGVSKLTAHEIVTLSSTGLSIGRKTATVSTDIMLRLEDLAGSCAGLNVSCDLTGGFDSRLLAVSLRHAGIHAEAALAAHSDGLEDVEIAKRVATVLRWPLLVSPHTLDHDLEEAHVAGDGAELWAWPKDWQNARARKARGVGLVVHGGGGELFTDFHHAHDFPIYGRRPDFGRVYDLRMAPTLPPLDRDALHDLRTRTIDRLQQHGGYDEAFYEIRAPERFGNQLSAYINLGLDVAVPFLDRPSVQAARRMPVWSRFRQGWHRRVMTALDREVAAIPTTSGYSASSELRHLPGDLVAYTREAGRRALNKAGQRWLRRAVLARRESLHPGYGRWLRTSPIAREAVERARVVLPGLAPRRLSDRHFARVVTLGMTMRALEGAELARTRGRSMSGAE